MKLIPLAILYLLGALSIDLRPNIESVEDKLTREQLNKMLETLIRRTELVMEWETILIGKTTEIPVVRLQIPQCHNSAILVPVIHDGLEIIHWVHLSRSIAAPNHSRTTHHAGESHKGFVRHRLEWNRIKISAKKVFGRNSVRGLNATVISELPAGCVLPDTLDLDSVWRSPIVTRNWTLQNQ